MKEIEDIIKERSAELSKTNDTKQDQEKWSVFRNLIVRINDLLHLDFKELQKEIKITSNELVSSVSDVKKSVKEIKFPTPEKLSLDPIVSKLNELQNELKILAEKGKFDPSSLISALGKLEPVKQEKVDLSTVIEATKKVETAIKGLKFSNSITKIDLTPILVALKKLDKPIPVITSEKIDLSSLEKATEGVEKAIRELEFPQIEPTDLSNVVEATENVEAAIRGLRFPVPTPVTQIDVNPLRGVFLTTAVSVGTTATALPASNLANRRSIIVYNNDASADLYIGGSAVTTSTGVPVSAGSYSPPVDAGNSMTLYGIVASGTVNVRVLEMSNDNIGSS